MMTRSMRRLPNPDVPADVRDWNETLHQVITALLRVVSSGDGVPALDAPLGTLYVDLVGGKLYVKEAAGTGGWVAK